MPLDDNPGLRFPPPEVVELGLEGIRSFLQAAAAGTQAVWESKLLLVGEGGVGKTCLYNALKGQLSTGEEPGTVGIDIGPLELAHPAQAATTMRLNCWDFAGQDFNHATHQFFFSDRALFLLVWNGRHGWQQGKLRWWLENIRARAPRAGVILVQTHIDQPHAGYPEITLRADFPQILGTAAVSNTTGEGIDQLRDLIRAQAAELPLMGLRWPDAWLAAAGAVRALREEGRLHASERRVLEAMQGQGLPSGQGAILLRWLHERGDVLHFAQESELKELVILQPEWLAKHVGLVLRSDAVLQKQGVLSRDHLDRDLWPDLDGHVRDHFLRMMDQFDLAYLIPNDPLDRSLIVERVPLDPPDYGPAWEKFAGQPEIAVRYRLDSMQPGIPTWFIARCHRFTMGLHWLQGVLFKDEGDRHRALIIADEGERTVEMCVRGPFPARFLALLQDGFQDTLRRYQGLQVKRLVPCPGYDELRGAPCNNEFDLESQERWISERPEKSHFDCPQCGTRLMRLQLVEGIGPPALTEDYRHQEILATVRDEGAKTRAHMDLGFADMAAFVRRNFLQAWQREQEAELISCPNLLTLRPTTGGGLLNKGRFVVQLYCQYHGGWHSLEPDGRYEVTIQREWLRRSLPYLKTLHKVLKIVVPLAGAALDVAGDAAAWAADQHRVLENEFELFDEFLKSSEPLLPAGGPLGEVTERIEARGTFRVYQGAELISVRELLDGLAERDKKAGKPKWGGLTWRQLPEGDIVWLCGAHLQEYESRPKATG